MGFDPRRVGGLFLRESLIVNVVGALLGLPLGLWLSIQIIEAHDREAYRLPIVASPLSYVMTVGIAIGFTLVAHLIVQRAIERLDWGEALNAKE